MATLNAIVYLIATSLTAGRDAIAGEKDLQGALTLTNGEHYRTGSVVADDYQEETLWQTTQGGLTTFDVAVIESDKDILLFLSDGAVDAIIQVKAGIPAIIGGQIDAALAGDGSADSPGSIDDIVAKRNVADGTGNAYVTLTLFG